MKLHLLSLFLFMLMPSVQAQHKPSSVPITIQWLDSIPGDFSFTNNWSYTLGVAAQENGLAGCADGGFCPERVYGMMDSLGNIPADSLEIYYQLLDTTHYNHSILCDAWCYEWAGTDYMHAVRKGMDSIACYTECGIATHCSLNLIFTGDNCNAYIKLNSIRPRGSGTFYCSSGYIRIDRHLWRKGIMKADFSFHFVNTHNPNHEHDMFWKGLVYTVIEKESR